MLEKLSQVARCSGQGEPDARACSRVFIRPAHARQGLFWRVRDPASPDAWCQCAPSQDGIRATGL